MTTQKTHLIEGMDYIIREVDFGNSAADGAVMSSPDGVAIIWINARVCQKRKADALDHELEHLANDDLYSERSVEEIERGMAI